jgi:glycosyltransferase involved in cell wall biosynthesis
MISMLRKRALRRALENCALPLESRWNLANQSQMPRDEWHSFDRTPWKHPWMTAGNIRAFSDYSRREIERLSHLVEEVPAKAGRYAFAGNLGNINYSRAAPLRRRGMNIDLILHPSDDSIFAQPGWEDFDGSIEELGMAPAATLAERGLPSWVFRSGLDSNWQQNIERYEVATPQRILMWTQYMPFLPTLEALSGYDALLVSQFPYLGLLSGRPYLFGQMGGEIWFEAARNDEVGIITRRGIENAYAILVSNPITLAHARRYGLRNLLYVPWILDEETYRPADARAVRAEWEREIGGDFFVLTSMRIDREWKGAHHALDGFAKFAAKVPGARLVVLSWGDDLEAAKATLEERNLSDRVLALPIVGKRRLVKYLQAADVVIEQFVLGYYGGSGLEAMACGKPVIMRLERDQYDALIESGAPPTLDAEDADGVERQLSRLYGDRQFAESAGRRTREWFLGAHSSLRWSNVYHVLLRAMSLGIPLSTLGSPLLAPLSNTEIDYHSDQLRQAPRFPDYTGPPGS